MWCADLRGVPVVGGDPAAEHLHLFLRAASPNHHDAGDRRMKVIAREVADTLAVELLKWQQVGWGNKGAVLGPGQHVWKDADGRTMRDGDNWMPQADPRDANMVVRALVEAGLRVDIEHREGECSVTIWTDDLSATVAEEYGSRPWTELLCRAALEAVSRGEDDAEEEEAEGASAA